MVSECLGLWKEYYCIGKCVVMNRVGKAVEKSYGGLGNNSDQA